VHFTQLDAAQSAQDFTSINLCTREEKAAHGQRPGRVQVQQPLRAGHRRWLKHGIGLHHAGLLPKYRVLVEQLTQKGLLKVICGTDTLGVGINMPIRTVLFTRFASTTAGKTGILSARGIFTRSPAGPGARDSTTRGWVVAQAPEHVVENFKLEEKAARGGKKVVKRKPPERNFVNWDKQTFLRLMRAPPERLVSVSSFPRHAAQRAQPQGRRLPRHAAAVRDCHETPKAKRSFASAPGSCSVRWWTARSSSSFPRRRRALRCASTWPCRMTSPWTRPCRFICMKRCR
jgi:hypothetical protein